MGQHPAGMRTYTLVCVGSCLIQLVSAYGFSEFQSSVNNNWRNDPARLSAQSVVGIGFLGAGSIMVHGITIRGLTTAAALWFTMALGMAVGMFFWFPLALCTLIGYITLDLLDRIEKGVARKLKVHEFLIQGVKTEQYGDILTCLSRVNGKLLKSRLLPSENLPGLHDVYIRIRVGKGVKAKHVVEELYRHAGLDPQGMILLDGKENPFFALTARADWEGSAIPLVKEATRARQRQMSEENRGGRQGETEEERKEEEESSGDEKAQSQASRSSPRRRSPRSVPARADSFHSSGSQVSSSPVSSEDESGYDSDASSSSSSSSSSSASDSGSSDTSTPSEDRKIILDAQT